MGPPIMIITRIAHIASMMPPRNHPAGLTCRRTIMPHLPMKILILLALALPTFAEVPPLVDPPLPVPQAPALSPATAHALFTPISQSTVRGAFGRAKKASIVLWTCQICNETATPVQLRRERVLMAAPWLLALPNDLAEDAIGRQVANDPQSFLGTNGNAVLTLGSTIATAAGVVAKSPAASYIGAGMLVGQFFINLATKRAPNAQPYFSRLLPSIVPLGAGGCDTYFIFASPVHNASPIIVEVR